MAVGLFLMLCTSFGTAIPLSSFYSYGSGVGDAALPPNDDGSSSAIPLPSPPFLYFGTSYTSIFVSLRTCDVSYVYRWECMNLQL